MSEEQSKGSYTTYDFEQSMIRIKDQLTSPIKFVHYGHGQISDDACCEDCGGEWSGGFVFELEDGRIGHLTGWCDYTGWGCQDGADVTWYKDLSEIKDLDKMDAKPADLNILIKDKGWLEKVDMA